MVLTDGVLPPIQMRLDGYDQLPRGAAYRAVRSPHTSERVSPFPNKDDIQRTDSEKSIGSCGENDKSGLTPAFMETDLARRAQKRVTDRKRTELEKKNEQEAHRLKKVEQEKLNKEEQNQVKHRRRAEIYALNAILRQVQQEKIAKFLAAQKQQQKQQEVQQQRMGTDQPGPVIDGPRLPFVPSIGV